MNNLNKLKEVDKLIYNFGLSMREAKVYTTLFHKKDFTASEIQQLVNIPRTKVYEVLHLLISKGLCAENKIGRYKKYQAVKPESSFFMLLQQQREDLSAKENIVNNILKILSPIYEQRKEKDNPLEYIEVLKDLSLIRKKFFILQKKVKTAMLVFNKSPYSTPTAGDNQPGFDALKRGVKIKSIYERDESMNEEFLEKTIIRFAAAGEEVRITDNLPIKLMIFDNSITMLALNDPISLKPSITTMIINHPSFALALKYVFESIWEKSIPFEEFKIKEKIS